MTNFDIRESWRELRRVTYTFIANKIVEDDSDPVRATRRLREIIFERATGAEASGFSTVVPQAEIDSDTAKLIEAAPFIIETALRGRCDTAQ